VSELHSILHSNKVLDSLYEAPTGIKVLENNLFIGWYSNNFEDVEEEFFPSKAIDEFIDRTVTGKTPLPELWSHHQSFLKHGQSLKVVRMGHFVVAVGVFDNPFENELVTPMKSWYGSSERVTMSHGFEYNPALYQDNSFWEFDTFEISTLRPGLEANPYTLFLSDTEEKSMSLSTEDRDFLTNILGKDRLAKFEQSADVLGKRIKGAGVAFKSKDDSEEVDDDLEAIIATLDEDLSDEEATPIEEVAELVTDDDAIKGLFDRQDVLIRELASMKVLILELEPLLAKVPHLEEGFRKLAQRSSRSSQVPQTVIPEDHEGASHLLKMNEERTEKSLSIISQIAAGIQHPSIPTPIKSESAID
jgi:hypothetical protein